MNRIHLAVLSFSALLLCSPYSVAQSYTISTIAGGASTPLHSKAVSQPIQSPHSVAAGPGGVLYASSCREHRIFKIAADGSLEAVAGTGKPGFSGDRGLAVSAEINCPGSIALDTAGNLFFIDGMNARIRKVTTDGLMRTVAGNGAQGYGTNAGDGGPATSAALNSPRGLAVDQAGNIFVVTISTVRKISPNGVIVTVVGAPASANLNEPRDIVVDSAGNLFLSESGNNRILKVSPAGAITTIVDSDSIRAPRGLALDAAGNLFIAEEGNGGPNRVAPRVRKLTSNGVLSVVAGNGVWGFSGDGGPAAGAQLKRPGGIAVDAQGNLYITDSESHRVRKVTAAGVISTVMGDGTYGFSGDDGPAVSAQLNWPDGVALDAAGNVFIADAFNGRIRKISPAGNISTIAGKGTSNISVSRASGDAGPATSAEISVEDVAVDAAGNVFITNYDRVHKVAPNGVISTVAGGDTARMYPCGLAVDREGNLFIADGSRHYVYKVLPNGTMSTVAGDGTAGFAGDGGPAISAKLQNPRGVAVDSLGNVFIADTDNKRIRKVSPAGIISTVAGRAEFALPVDEIPALSSNLAGTRKVAVDKAGNIYISDTFRIRKVTTDGIIHTIAGNGKEGFSGDGGAGTAATLSYTQGIAVDSDGNVFFADGSNNRVRKLTPSPQGLETNDRK